MPVWNTRLFKPPHHLVSFPNPLALESEAENLSTHLCTSWKILIMASQAHCNQMQILQQGLTNKKWFEIARKKSNIGISGDFNAILRRFLWRLPRADNSYEKKRAILWGLPMNSMHRWCKRKRLKSGGGLQFYARKIPPPISSVPALSADWIQINQNQHNIEPAIWFFWPSLWHPPKHPKQGADSQVPQSIYVWFWMDFWGLSATPYYNPVMPFLLLSPKIDLYLLL